MFELLDDYCVVDGNLCVPGAIYCSNECRLSDTQVSSPENVARSPLMTPSDNIVIPRLASPAELLYPSLFYTAGSAAEPTILDLTYNFSVDVFDPSKYYTERVKSFAADLVLQTSVLKYSTGYLSKNYRTWLLQCTP